VGRGGHPRGGAGVGILGPSGRVSRRRPTTRSPGRSGWMGPSSGGDGVSQRDGRYSSTVEDDPLHRANRASSDGLASAQRSMRLLRECDRAGPAARVRRRPPGSLISRSPPISKPRECHSPTTADRLSVAVRRHPRSPLDQLLEERLEERLAEDHIVSRRRSRCFA
jgi:hypothetical protein